ncbi:Hypothetical protein PHPALM_3544 [Phytophthora palmivora]|uniref:PiggyBac transposable element-derived protein domain-containing protein n=1 Tax=Phytophthora palmivora TaxID=4796 RepID=A0A2P4YMA2_9STRA|nr:Hypothetical protein PHPALM_3544 [Phytophthora palmivora]
MRDDPPADHPDFISQLHTQLLNMGEVEFAGTAYSSGPITLTQCADSATSRNDRIEMGDEWVEVNGVRMRRQRQCKACTIHKTVSTKRQVMFYCSKCNKGHKRVYLRDKVRQGHYPNNDLAFYAIWHQLWRNESTPAAALSKEDVAAAEVEDIDASGEEDED